VIVVALVGTVSCTSTPRQPNFSGLVDIGGRKIYMQCSGSGTPTVILISGLDTAADLWNAPEQPGPKVFPQVAMTTRVCAYDRPGAPTTLGKPSRNDPVPQPTTTQNAVDDLHALLKAAKAPGPYVFAAHSYGGLIARLYANLYPHDVVGVVFVDVLTPELRDGMTHQWWEAWKIANARSAEAIAEYPALERLDIDQSLDQLDHARTLRPMPVVVLSADQLYGRDIEQQVAAGKLPKGVPPELGYVIDSINKGAQEKVAALVPGARHVTDTHSGHNMMIDQPMLVTDAILQVVDAVRDGRSTVIESRAP